MVFILIYWHGGNKYFLKQSGVIVENKATNFKELNVKLSIFYLKQVF